MSKKKLNNKGFAVSAMLYTLLTAFLLFLGASLAQFSSSAKILSNANKDLTDGFTYDIGVYYKVNGGQPESSPSYKLNGQFLIDGEVYKNFVNKGKTPWTLFATTNFSYVNKYSYPAVGLPYAPLTNDFVNNTVKLKRNGYRFVGWSNPEIKWEYKGSQPTYGPVETYNLINNTNLLDYMKKHNPDETKEVNTLQIIYTAKWDVDVFVYYIYPENASGSTLSEVKVDPITLARYKYVEGPNDSLAYDNKLLSDINDSDSLINYSQFGSNCTNLNQKVNFYDGNKNNVEEGVTINNNIKALLNKYHDGKGKDSSTIQIIVDRRGSTCN